MFLSRQLQVERQRQRWVLSWQLHSSRRSGKKELYEFLGNFLHFQPLFQNFPDFWTLLRRKMYEEIENERLITPKTVSSFGIQSGVLYFSQEIPRIFKYSVFQRLNLKNSYWYYVWIYSFRLNLFWPGLPHQIMRSIHFQSLLCIWRKSVPSIDTYTGFHYHHEIYCSIWSDVFWEYIILRLLL